MVFIDLFYSPKQPWLLQVLINEMHYVNVAIFNDTNHIWSKMYVNTFLRNRLDITENKTWTCHFGLSWKFGHLLRIIRYFECEFKFEPNRINRSKNILSWVRHETISKCFEVKCKKMTFLTCPTNWQLSINPSI